MGRLPQQVLVLPFRRGADGAFQYALFRRSDYAEHCWQGIAGGVEFGETKIEAAQREMEEEAGIPSGATLVALDAVASVPACHFAASDDWGPDIYVVTEHCFGVRLEPEDEIVLSSEHVEFCWKGYEEASSMLRWDSNRTALWELNTRLSKNLEMGRELTEGTK
jgi:dATP pyrophosphohydrolase